MNRINSQRVSCRLSDVRCQKGFSLLELLIYIAVIAVMTVVIVGTFIAIDKGRGNVESKSEVNTNLRFALEKITNDVRSATAVTTPATPGGTTSAALNLTVSAATVYYCVSGGQLWRQSDAVTCGVTGSPQAVTATTVTVAAPTFTRLENTNTYLSKTIISIKVDLNMSYNSSSPDYQYSQRKVVTASLRQ